jgi:hypothetical protein
MSDTSVVDPDGTGTGAAVVVQPQPQIQDPAAAAGYLARHAALGAEAKGNYEDIMKRRQEAIDAVRGKLDDTIAQMRDAHNGGKNGVNLPMLAFAAGLGQGKDNSFSSSLGGGFAGAARAIQGQRMQDEEFLKGISELQQKQGALGDIVPKEQADLAKRQQLAEEAQTAQIEKAQLTSKALRPYSLGKDAMGNPIIMDPRANNGQGAMVGADGKPITLDPTKAIGSDGKNLIGSDVHGDAFLKQLDPTLAAAVKGYGDYETELKTGVRSPAMANYQNYIFSLAKQYDPDFNAGNYAVIQKGKKDWTGNGTMAQRAVSAATIPGHLADLQGAAADLNNSGLLKGNTIANLIATQSGDPRVAAFVAARQAVMTEIPSFLGKGHPAEGQILAWLGTIDKSDSPAQMNAAIKGLSLVMHTQLETIAEAKSRDYGKPGKFSTDDLIGKDNAGAMADIVNTDIDKEGGAMAAMRRRENHMRSVGQKPLLPTFTQEQWQAGIEHLKANPALKEAFDAKFGPGSADKVLSR